MKADLKLAIIGDPVEHSLSPAMHAEALWQCELTGSYERLRATKTTLRDVLQAMREDRYDGFNVTAPLKEDVVLLLDGLDPAAAAIGAVNTVVKQDGDLIGYNSDASGFGRIVDSLGLVRNRNAMVIGAGGAARACVDTLYGRGWSITVANRTLERAGRAFLDKAEVIDLTPERLARSLAGASLLLNASSAGMNRPWESPLPPQIILDSKMTVVESVYVPLETRLLREAGKRGCRIVDGLTFLAAQAADAFELWTGSRLSDDFFRGAAEHALSQAPDGVAQNEQQGNGQRGWGDINDAPDSARHRSRAPKGRAGIRATEP